MARLLVIDREGGTRTPFLRGILTQSLLDAGLPFDDAYRVASQVRGELEDRDEVDVGDLAQIVAAKLPEFGQETADRYRAPDPLPPAILVTGADGQLQPFSRWRHRIELEICGLSTGKATALADAMQARLLARGSTELRHDELQRVTYDSIRHELGAKSARRYLVWQEYREAGPPLIILLAGAVGTGKSTLAGRLAYHLEVVRSQSTDMLREVMRVMLPAGLLPVLHTSTFEAWSALPEHEHLGQGSGRAHHRAVIRGYLSQADLVYSAVEAVVQRAQAERVSLVLEGAHIHPALIEKLPRSEDAIFVPMVLGVLDPKELRKRLKARGKQSPERTGDRYLRNFEAIWSVQELLLDEADQVGIPIIENLDEEESLRNMTGEVLRVLGKHFKGDPKSVLQ